MLFFIVFLCPSIIHGQSRKQKTRIETDFYGIQSSFIFNNNSLGGSLGFVLPVKQLEVTKTKRYNKFNFFFKTQQVNFQMVYIYSDPSNKTILFVTDYDFEKRYKNGFYYKAGFGIGIARSFTYDRDYISASGNSEGNTFAGKLYATPSLNIGVGYNFKLKKEKRFDTISPFFNINFRPLIPEYKFLNPLLYFEFGLKVNIFKRKE
jgi:hypothetical protein